MKPVSPLLLVALTTAFVFSGCKDSVSAGDGQDAARVAADAQVDWPLSFDQADEAEADSTMTDAGGPDRTRDLADSSSPTDTIVPPEDTGQILPCSDYSEPDACEADPECRWLVPACVDEPNPEVLENAGCYPALECEGEDCGQGTVCVNRWINPCWNSPCGACGAESHVCMPESILCGDEELSAGFGVRPAVDPVEVSDSVDDYVLEGTVTYYGAPTVPNPTPEPFDREVRIEHADGTVSTIQFYLPLELELPVEVDGYYTFTYRVAQFFEIRVQGLVITRPTSGVHPLLFTAEVGASRYARVFTDDDDLFSPLHVYQVEDETCPNRPDKSCGGDIYSDALVFDSSTGAAFTEVRLFQGAWASLPVFGDNFTVVNLASTRIEPTCPDDRGGHTAYLAMRQPAGVVACWDQRDCEDGQSCRRHGVCLPAPGCEDGCDPVCYGMCE